ncbi:MAG: hypothetical protein AAF646_03350 [Pseudomonadota bacterium]
MTVRSGLPEVDVAARTPAARSITIERTNGRPLQFSGWEVKRSVDSAAARRGKSARSYRIVLYRNDRGGFVLSILTLGGPAAETGTCQAWNCPLEDDVLRWLDAFGETLRFDLPEHARVAPLPPASEIAQELSLLAYNRAAQERYARARSEILEDWDHRLWADEAE